MEPENNRDNDILPTKKILIAPLNWGLGHATRCIPLIRHLTESGHEVVLASDGAALLLLKAEFPNLAAFAIPSYRITYDTANMVWNIARQLPRILFAIRAERWATQHLVQAHQITHIISDNRYGCFTKATKNVLLTHQLHLRIPSPLLSWVANRLLHRALSKFGTVWVPDTENDPNLSAELSHPPLQKPRTTYTGLLSRMVKSPDEASDHLAANFSPPVEDPEGNIEQETPPLQVAIVLSGPEPQRSYLEQRLLEQAIALPHKFFFIQGKPQQKKHYYAADNVEVISYLTTDDLRELLSDSDAIVCRSGYSSIMDLAVLGKKALIIPTPGQTEQEYLAHNLSTQKIFVAQSQDALQLAQGLDALEDTTGFDAAQFDTEQFRGVLDAWMGE